MIFVTCAIFCIPKEPRLLGMLLWSQCLTNVTSPSLFPSSVWGGGGVFGPSGHRLPGHWPLPAGHQRLWQRQLPQRAAVVQRSVGQRVAGLHSLQHSRRAVRGEVSVLKPAPLLENTSPFSVSFFLIPMLVIFLFLEELVVRGKWIFVCCLVLRQSWCCVKDFSNTPCWLL